MRLHSKGLSHLINITGSAACVLLSGNPLFLGATIFFHYAIRSARLASVQAGLFVIITASLLVAIKGGLDYALRHAGSLDGSEVVWALHFMLAAVTWVYLPRIQSRIIARHALPIAAHSRSTLA